MDVEPVIAKRRDCDKIKRLIVECNRVHGIWSSIQWLEQFLFCKCTHGYRVHGIYGRRFSGLGSSFAARARMDMRLMHMTSLKLGVWRIYESSEAIMQKLICFQTALVYYGENILRNKRSLPGNLVKFYSWVAIQMVDC